LLYWGVTDAGEAGAPTDSMIRQVRSLCREERLLRGGAAGGDRHRSAAQPPRQTNMMTVHRI
jgi:hypothetical protein